MGFGDPASQRHVENVEKSLKRQLTPEIYGRLRIFHFRGGMFYSKMRFLHRLMMRMMVAVLRSRPADKLSADDKLVLETFGKDIDCADQSAIGPLLREARQEAAQ